MKILLSRVDSIGDVVLSLPVAGAIKKKNPDAEIWWLGADYTKPILERCVWLSGILIWNPQMPLDLKTHSFDYIIHIFPKSAIAWAAWKANIPNRIGTSHRWYHWLLCNQLINLGRKNSDLHETELNLSLIPKAFTVQNPDLSEIDALYGLKTKELQKGNTLISKTKINLLIHPRSKGSAREIPLATLKSVIKKLDSAKYQIFIGGTLDDGRILASWIQSLPSSIVNICGKFSLGEYIDFIASIDGLVAGSTGPLHIASAMGKFALGLYPPLRPMHPGRWKPIGKNAHYITGKTTCLQCSATAAESSCECMNLINYEDIVKIINNMFL